jgi:PAS domain-containing protein
MTKTNIGSGQVRRSVGAVAEAVLRASREARTVERIVERSHVPMAMVDVRRRYVEANRPARLVFRLGLDEIRTSALDALTPRHLDRDPEQAWARLLDRGCVVGSYQAVGRDVSWLDIVYRSLVDVVPGLARDGLERFATGHSKARYCPAIASEEGFAGPRCAQAGAGQDV